MKTILTILLALCAGRLYAQDPAVIFDEDMEITSTSVKKILANGDFPKICVLPKKSNTDQHNQTAIAEVNSKLGDLGFQYVPSDAILEFMQNINSYSKGQEYQDIATKANARFYITISCKISSNNRISSGYTSVANIEINAFDSETGLGLGSTTISSGIVGSSESYETAQNQAVKEAAKKGAEKIIKKIIISMLDRSKDGYLYEVKLYNVKDYNLARDFKTALKQKNGFVGDIRLSKMDDCYRFELRFKSSKEDDLIDAVYDALRTNPNFRKLELKNSSGKMINFTL